MLYSIMIDLNCSCNLRCIYCGTDKIIHNYNIFDTIKEFINLNLIKETDKLIVKFKEQEPFYGIDKLEFITKAFITDSLDKNYNLHFTMITNGTLLGEEKVQKYLRTYKKYFTSFIISLDGYKDVQDLQRPGSWDRIVENWDFLRKYTNDNIKISSVCAHPALNIYASSLIKLITEFKGIDTIISNMDTNEGYTIKDVDTYIRQGEQIYKYINEHNLNIKLEPFQPVKNNKSKDIYMGRGFHLKDKIIETKRFEKCEKCTVKNCEIYYEREQSSERLNIQCYMFKKIEEFLNTIVF